MSGELHVGDDILSIIRRKICDQQKIGKTPRFLLIGPIVHMRIGMATKGWERYTDGKKFTEKLYGLEIAVFGMNDYDRIEVV